MDFWTKDDYLIFLNEMVKSLNAKDLRFLVSFLNIKLKIKEINEKIKGE